jgi:hypothetical protein
MESTAGGRSHGVLGSGVYHRWIFSCGDTWRSTFMQTFEDLVSRLQAAETAVDVDMLRRFERTPCGELPSTLKWTKAALTTYSNYEMSMFRSDTLRHSPVTCTSNTERHRTYVMQYFRLFFFKGITLWGSCSQILFHPIYIRTYVCV